MKSPRFRHASPDLYEIREGRKKDVAHEPPKDEGSRVRPVACPRDKETIMRRFRFSIASLLGAILFISVALAALRASTDVWDGCLLGLALLILLTAILLAVHRTDRKRAY